MIELVLSAAEPIIRRLRDSKLPDCAAILEDVQSGGVERLPNPSGYVFLCRVTTAGLFIRTLGQFWLVLAALFLIRHFPFTDFGEHQHQLFVQASLFPTMLPAIQTQLREIPICKWLTYFSVLAVVACGISVDIIARLSQFLASECCKKAEVIRQTGTAA